MRKASFSTLLIAVALLSACSDASITDPIADNGGDNGGSDPVVAQPAAASASVEWTGAIEGSIEMTKGGFGEFMGAGYLFMGTEDESVDVKIERKGGLPTEVGEYEIGIARYSPRPDSVFGADLTIDTEYGPESYESLTGTLTITQVSANRIVGTATFVGEEGYSGNQVDVTVSFSLPRVNLGN